MFTLSLSIAGAAAPNIGSSLLSASLDWFHFWGKRMEDSRQRRTARKIFESYQNAIISLTVIRA